MNWCVHLIFFSLFFFLLFFVFVRFFSWCWDIWNALELETRTKFLQQTKYIHISNMEYAVKWHLATNFQCQSTDSEREAVNVCSVCKGGEKNSSDIHTVKIGVFWVELSCIVLCFVRASECWSNDKNNRIAEKTTYVLFVWLFGVVFYYSIPLFSFKFSILSFIHQTD